MNKWRGRRSEGGDNDDSETDMDKDKDREGWMGFLKRIQLLFVAAASLGSIVFVVFLLFLFFVFIFVVRFSLCSYLEFANELRLKTKSHAKQSAATKRKVPKERNGTSLTYWRTVGRGCEKVYFILIFFRKKIEMRFIYYVFILNVYASPPSFLFASIISQKFAAPFIALHLNIYVCKCVCVCL